MAASTASGANREPSGEDRNGIGSGEPDSGLLSLFRGQRLRFLIIVLVALLWFVAQCAHRSQRADQSSSAVIGVQVAPTASSVISSGVLTGRSKPSGNFRSQIALDPARTAAR